MFPAHIMEFIAFVFGILSVVRQTGKYFSISHRIIATIISVYLLFLCGLSGDMMINGYFTIMSIWYKWSRKQKTATTYQSQEPTPKKK
jgi:nicotinamide mononucleotide transporter